MLDFLRTIADQAWVWVAANFGLRPDPNVKAWVEFAAAAVTALGILIVPWQLYEYIVAKPVERRRQRARERAELVRIAAHDKREAERDRELRETHRIVEELRSLMRAGQPGQAQAIEAAVANAETQSAAGDDRMTRALQLLDQRKPKEAAALFQAVAEEKATRVRVDSKEAAAAYRHLGAIAGLGDPTKARIAYAKAGELDPDHAEGMLWLGWLLKDYGDLNGAERAFRRIQALSNQSTSEWAAYWAQLGLGDIAVERGNLDGARAAFSAGRGRAERLAKADPNNTGWQRDLSVSYDRVGGVLVAQGNLPEALKAFRDSLAIRDTLANADPDNAGWQRELSVSYEKIGNVLVAQGNLPEALKAFRDSLAIRDTLANADPGNAGWQRDLSVSYDRVGDVLVEQGNLPEALKAFRDSLAIRDTLANADPGNAGWQRDLSVSYNKLGDVLVAQGNLADALKAFRDSLAIADTLANADPGNAGWTADLAASHGKLGLLLERMGQRAEALETFRKGRQIVAPLVERSPDHALWKGYLDSFGQNIARLGK